MVSCICQKSNEFKGHPHIHTSENKLWSEPLRGKERSRSFESGAVVDTLRIEEVPKQPVGIVVYFSMLIFNTLMLFNTKYRMQYI